MATILGVLSAHIQDSYGIVGTVPVNIEVPDTVTVAQLATFANGYEAVIGDDNLTQGQVLKVTIQLEFAIGADATVPAGDIEKGGLFNFGNAATPYRQGVLVPDINPAVLNSAGLIDLTNTVVTDFVTFMTTAHTGIVIVTKGLQALTGLIDALIAFRKHRKPLSRKTTERG